MTRRKLLDTVESTLYLPLGRFNHAPRSIKGRSRSRRFFLRLLTPRQRFCFQYLGRYTLKGSEGTHYKIETDAVNSHQWFYILSNSNKRYYFSLVAQTIGASLADDIYRNLISIHMALVTDERNALITANWDWYKDKEQWLRKQQPLPPQVTFAKIPLQVTFAKKQPGRYSNYVKYFPPFLWNYLR